MYLQSVSMMPKGIFYADPRLANYLYFEMPLIINYRANDFSFTLCIEQLGRDVAGEIESDWMVPLLGEEERERLIAWQLGVSL